MGNISFQAQALFEETAAIRRAMQGSRGSLLSEFNLTRPQTELLFVISERPGQTVGQLATAMGITNGAATQMIEVMVKRDLAVRIPSQIDRRVTHVDLTPSGKKLASKVQKHHGDLMADVLAGLSEEEMENIVGLMRKLRQHVERNLVKTN